MKTTDDNFFPEPVVAVELEGNEGVTWARRRRGPGPKQGTERSIKLSPVVVVRGQIPAFQVFN